MKLFKQIIIILILFFKTGTLLSANNLFNVNNILLEKKDNEVSSDLANQAIKKGFNKLINKVLLKEDIVRVSDLNFVTIKDLVTFYNISNNSNKLNNEISFNISFDKEKIHNLFYKKGILYSDISDKEFFILPILIRKNKIFIFANNYFYNNWNISNENELIEFILPQENIEIIQKINKSRDNLYDLNLTTLLTEYKNKNIAIVLIDETISNKSKIFLRARIENKYISKSLTLISKNDELERFKENIIFEIKNVITNLVKSQNLIDIRTPSFLNVKLNLNKKNNLYLFNLKIKDIGSIEKIFVQQFNRDYVNLRIKYLGKIEKLINQLKNENINLHLVNDEWVIKIL